MHQRRIWAQTFSLRKQIHLSPIHKSNPHHDISCKISGKKQRPHILKFCRRKKSGVVLNLALAEWKELAPSPRTRIALAGCHWENGTAASPFSWNFRVGKLDGRCLSLVRKHPIGTCAEIRSSYCQGWDFLISWNGYGSAWILVSWFEVFEAHRCRSPGPGSSESLMNLGEA